ncbi:MAG: chromate transporter [Candidatus Bathyarchaeia archaeon]
MGSPSKARGHRYLELFLIFSKISAFTLGGGLAMIPLIEKEVIDKKRWIGGKEFLDLVGITQSMPGAMAINLSICVGYKVAGIRGAISAFLGAILPPFLSIVLAASLFFAVKENPLVERAFQGIRPAVVALITISALRLSRAAGVGKRTVAIPIGIALIVLASGLHPMYMAAIGIAGSALWAASGVRRGRP